MKVSAEFPRFFHFRLFSFRCEMDSTARTQQEEEPAAELESYRESALKSNGISSTGQFSPFETSRTSSPIPGHDGLGWPGEFVVQSTATLS